MDIDGLDYNTQRNKLRLMAYGRDIQQMVEHCVALPTKGERQRCAETIINVMRRVVPSPLENKERTAALWYHLALISDFKLDIDYPVDIVHEDKMATKPDKIEYASKRPINVKHYGRLLFGLFEKLKTMPPGEERDALAEKTANQMYRSLVAWGMGTADKEKVASDLARFTDGVIQLDVQTMHLDRVMGGSTIYGSMMLNSQKKKKRKKK